MQNANANAKCKMQTQKTICKTYNFLNKQYINIYLSIGSLLAKSVHRNI
jgi:hypothetical protein